MRRLATLFAGLALCANAFALSLADLSQKDASGGLRDALSQGARIAVQQLGRPGGFSPHPTGLAPLIAQKTIKKAPGRYSNTVLREQGPHPRLHIPQ